MSINLGNVKEKTLKRIAEEIKNLDTGEYQLTIKEYEFGSDKYYFRKENNNIIARRVREKDEKEIKPSELNDYLNSIQIN